MVGVKGFEPSTPTFRRQRERSLRAVSPLARAPANVTRFAANETPDARLLPFNGMRYMMHQ